MIIEAGRYTGFEYEVFPFDNILHKKIGKVGPL
jgi:hypothetical protein